MATLIEKSQKLKTKAFVKADFDRGGISRAKLARLVEKGSLERIERGIYRGTDAAVSEFESLATASLIAPKAVVCLLSALQFHDLTTQNPFEVWLAIAPHAHRPKAGNLSLRLVHFSGGSQTEGIEEHTLEGIPVKIYGVAKTVADCFKFRNKIGLDIALEALREIRRKKLCTMDEIWYYAKICRVSNVMRPYLEAIV
ncbi:MAG: type IV toxin-antitoxin system AbiEi family antitoxin domain-containing protein [Acidobacteriota bacterium]|nr:type IV toxin-antitoxin system AbiEi family antitoxin domain-containing protein [Acidobacteriota bacterium]